MCCCQHLQETFPYTHGTGTADATVVDGYVSLGFSIKRGIVDREKGVEGPLLVSAVHGTGTGGVGTWNPVAAVLCLCEELSHVQEEPPSLSRQGCLATAVCAPLFEQVQQLTSTLFNCRPLSSLCATQALPAVPSACTLPYFLLSLERKHDIHRPLSCLFSVFFSLHNLSIFFLDFVASGVVHAHGDAGPARPDGGELPHGLAHQPFHQAVLEHDQHVRLPIAAAAAGCPRLGPAGNGQR